MTSNAPGADARIRTIKTWGIERKSLSTLTYGFTSALFTLTLRPDVVLVMNVANGFWLPLLRAARIPTVVNVDGIEWQRAKWGRLAKAVFRAGAWFTAKFANAIICDAEEIRRIWRQDLKRDGVFIPYGADVPSTLPLEPELEHRGYALMVARFVPENSVPQFLEAALSVAKTSKVVIVGSSGYGGPLDEAAATLDRCNPNVSWLGHVHEHSRLLSLWQHAGVYFHGHTVGGTNPALVQAMACGAPTVAVDTPYNREVLGTAGFFVNAASEEISDAILAVMRDPNLQEATSGRALARASHIYTWPSVSQAYHGILRRYASRGQASHV
jgi:glycosyltransferase involved in cell wall biosynthesis